PAVRGTPPPAPAPGVFLWKPAGWAARGAEPPPGADFRPVPLEVAHAGQWRGAEADLPRPSRRSPPRRLSPSAGLPVARPAACPAGNRPPLGDTGPAGVRDDRSLAAGGAGG